MEWNKLCPKLQANSIHMDSQRKCRSHVQLRTVRQLALGVAGSRNTATCQMSNHWTRSVQSNILCVCWETGRAQWQQQVNVGLLGFHRWEGVCKMLYRVTTKTHRYNKLNCSKHADFLNSTKRVRLTRTRQWLLPPPVRWHKECIMVNWTVWFPFRLH